MPEHQHIEWKENWRDEYMRQLCGFANADGGTLVIGRDNKGRPVGVTNTRKLLEDLPNKIRDILGIMADVRLVTEAGRDLVEIRVGAYPSPISYKGEYHYRSGSTKQELKGEALTRFLLRKHGKTWDDVPLPGVKIRGLSKDAIRTFRKLSAASGRTASDVLREKDVALLEKLKLTEGDYLKRAAVLLFHAEPRRYVTGAFVKIGFFRSESDLAYHDEINGDLFSQTRQTVDLVMTKYLKAAITYQGIQRIERYPVPREALREAVLNALIHRDYAVPAPVQIRVHEDRLRMWNPAILPERWTLKKLLNRHASLPYNPLVADAFFRAGEIEAWGRGIERIFQACRDGGAPAPLVSYDPNDLWLEFPFGEEYLNLLRNPENAEENEGENLKNEGENSKNEGENLRNEGEGWYEKWYEKWYGKWYEKWGEKMTAHRSRIVQVMHHNPRISVEGIAGELGVAKSGVIKHLKVMREAGCIRRVGPAKGGHWEVIL
ncbi:MAG: putative DNA binding domain-containing protein [Opitutaceae bacterium]|nr:putative DNA binding domain-containing protein [Opitutaceae bacterium]